MLRFLIPALFAASPVLAHTGEHQGMSLSAFLDHLMEWDHLAMIAAIAFLGLLVWRRFGHSSAKGE